MKKCKHGTVNKIIRWVTYELIPWIILIMVVGFMVLFVADVIMLFILLCKLYYYGF